MSSQPFPSHTTDRSEDQPGSGPGQPAELAPGVLTMFTSRAGGVSAAPYDTLNMGASAGDSSTAKSLVPPSTSKIAAAESPAAGHQGPDKAGADSPAAEPAAANNPEAGPGNPAGAGGGADGPSGAADQGNPAVDGVPAPRAAETATAADPADQSLAAARTGSGTGAPWLPDNSSTRRRSVVFEEDDDLDVPDFLK